MIYESSAKDYILVNLLALPAVTPVRKRPIFGYLLLNMKSPIFADEERIFQPDSSSSPTIGLNQSPFIFYERSRLFTAADALSGSLISCKYYSTCRLKCRRGHVYRRSIYQR